MSSLAPHRPPKMADDATVASSTAMDIEKASTSPPSPPATDADLEKSSHVPPSPPKPLAFEPNDPDDPHNWPLWRQRCYSLILGYATLSLTFNSSAYASSVPELMAAFNMSYVVAVLGVSLFVVGFAFGPLFFGPASEVFGRRPIYLASFFVFTAFSIGAAVANNAAALLLCRFFAGLGGASALTNAPPSMSDFADSIYRGRFAAIYGACAFGGPALGPLIGGFVASRAGFRWNLGVQAIVAGIGFFLVALIPETHNPTIIRKRALKSSDPAARDSIPPALPLSKRLRVAFTLPFRLFCTEPIVFAVCCYMALVYGLLYGFFSGLPYAFQSVRGFSREDLALVYISLFLGGIAGGLILYYPGSRSMVKLIEQRTKEGKAITPEDRLTGARLIAPTVPIGLFIFAFTSYANVHWFGQMVGLFLFMVGIVVVFVSFVPYIIDCYLPNAASALAATAFTRAIAAAGFPLFTRQMFEAMTVAGAVGLFAGIATLMTPLPHLFIVYGERLRAKSRYAF